MVLRSKGSRVPTLLGRKLGVIILVLALTIYGVPPKSFSSEPIGQTNKKPSTGSSAKTPAPEDLLLVRLGNGADREKFDQTLQEAHGTYLRTIDAGPELQFLVIQTEPGQAADVEKKLKEDKDVSLVQRNTRYRLNSTSLAAPSNGTPVKVQSAASIGGNFIPASLAPSDPFYSAQWDLTAMSYAQGRLLAKPIGTFLPIYFLDTGMTYFPGESSFICGQYDFSSPTNPTGDFESIHDSGTHGTGTSSVTAASDNGIGYAGMANFESNHCVVYMMRITQDGETAYEINIVSALSYILKNPLCTPGPINISFGPAPPNSLNADSTIQLLGYYLLTKGCLVVLAAGNSSWYDPSPELFCRRVAATDQNGNLAYFSNIGPFTTAAPGVSVPVYTPSGGPSSETFASGTSFSAPRWCSAILQIMAATKNPKNRNAYFADTILRNTATTTSGGLQIPNLGAAMQLVNEL